MQATSSTAAKRAMFVLLLGALALVALVMRPLATAFFLAAVFAGVLWPLDRWLTRKLGDRPRLAATLVVLIVFLAAVAPLVALSAFIANEASEAVRFVFTTVRGEGMAGLISRLPDSVERYARMLVDQLPAVRAQVAGSGAAALSAAVTATRTLLFQGAMMLIALYFFLSQKAAILTWIDEASPLGEGRTLELLAEVRNVSRSVLSSSVLTAFVQALVALLGYAIARVPHPIFFAAVTFFFALVPLVGAAGVAFLAALLLFATGHPVGAIFLAAWAVFVVGLVDNVVKPMLIRRGYESGMSGIVVFFALLGGLAAFGPIGLLVGPVSVALFVAVLRVWKRDYGQRPMRGSPLPPGEGQGEGVRVRERPTRVSARASQTN